MHSIYADAHFDDLDLDTRWKWIGRGKPYLSYGIQIVHSMTLTLSVTLKMFERLVLLVFSVQNLLVTYLGLFIGGDYIFSITNFMGINIRWLGWWSRLHSRVAVCGCWVWLFLRDLDTPGEGCEFAEIGCVQISINGIGFGDWVCINVDHGARFGDWVFVDHGYGSWIMEIGSLWIMGMDHFSFLHLSLLPLPLRNICKISTSTC